MFNAIFSDICSQNDQLAARSELHGLRQFIHSFKYQMCSAGVDNEPAPVSIPNSDNQIIPIISAKFVIGLRTAGQDTDDRVAKKWPHWRFSEKAGTGFFNFTCFCMITARFKEVFA
ncbi:MAG: hypothetical protein FT726_24940 [Pantoea sp. Morm]|jgi:hypothetical protein|uniref:Uncharacterized protein n=1 Tax=Candidatus Pantoea communis TaxID=2608354 RepID=A0ABX0S0T2_9GAMM|nr:MULTISPECIES: hypothetical protein [Enterobacterales]KGT86796.1 hypothetical protein NH00_24465 [Enterobacter cancerogenus]MBK4772855.1 hypothetical protein [Pantoea sp. Morm]NIG22406.1 hypothetical protein [Pantoea communis]